MGLLPTLLHVQDLTRVNLHLCLAVSLIPAEPAVTGEHVMFPVDRDHDLNTVQEPAGSHAFIGVADHQAADLEKGMNGRRYLNCSPFIFGSKTSLSHLSNIKGFHGEDVNAARLKVVPQVVGGDQQRHRTGVAFLPVEFDEHVGVRAASGDAPCLHRDVIVNVWHTQTECTVRSVYRGQIYKLKQLVTYCRDAVRLRTAPTL